MTVVRTPTPERSFLVLVVMLVFFLGAALGIGIARLFYIAHSDIVAPQLLFSARLPLPLPSMKTIAVKADNDAAAIQAVVDYFRENSPALAEQFQELNPTRLEALYAMYMVHVSHVYAEVPEWPASFMDYLQMPQSHCGTTAWAQAELLQAMGITWRIMGLTDSHVFLEVLIDDQWEYFDATINVWADRSAYEMERGAERDVRKFYTPLLDAAYRDDMTPEALRVGQELRQLMPGYGLYYYPKAYLYVENEGTLTT